MALETTVLYGFLGDCLVFEVTTKQSHQHWGKKGMTPM
jgi:hypothetical protein